MSFIQGFFVVLFIAALGIFLLVWFVNAVNLVWFHKHKDAEYDGAYLPQTTPVYTSPAGTLPPPPEADDWEAYQQDMIESLKEENARIQREAEDRAAARQRIRDRYQVEKEQKQREADEQAAAEQARLEEIDATYEPWFLELAKEKKIPHVMADLQQFEAWLLLIFDLCRDKYNNGFPQNALWQDLKQINVPYQRGHTTIEALAKVLIKNGLLIPHAGGPYPYQLADNARDRIRKQKRDA